MPTSVWFPQYRDEFAGTPYPFADGAALADDTGAIAIARGMVVDAAVYPVGGGPGLAITRVVVAPQAVTLVVGTAAAPALCSCVFNPLEPPESLPLEDAYGRPAGLLVCDPGQLAAAQAWPAGEYTFRAGRAEFVATCTVPVPADAGLRGIVVGGRVLAGDVWLAGADGVVLREDGPGMIRVDAVGDPLSKRRLCGDGGGGFSTPRFVRTINGIPPDEFGDWKLTVAGNDAADTALRLVPEPPEGLRLEVAGRPVAG